jgi:hypothetical protein
MKDYVIDYLTIHNFGPAGAGQPEGSGCKTNSQLQNWWVKMEALRSVPNSPPWVQEGQDCTQLVDVMATYIMLVTGQHSHFGTTINSATSHVCIAPFNMLDPAQLPSLPNEYNCGSPSAIMYSYLLMSATQFESPKIVDDFTHLFHSMGATNTQMEQASKDAWTQMTVEMMALDATIATENQSRFIPFYSFMPSLVEISTAV